jgi:hypothetical protein
VWDAAGAKTSGTWEEVFGKGAKADEIFMGWNYARYLNAVAEAGKKEYAIPMFVNAWIVQPEDKGPGDYPSGGPQNHMHDIWRAGAPQDRPALPRHLSARFHRHRGALQPLRQHHLRSRIGQRYARRRQRLLRHRPAARHRLLALRHRQRFATHAGRPRRAAAPVRPPPDVEALPFGSNRALCAAGIAARQMNFDLNWKFIREDVPGAEAPGFDDSAMGDRQHAAFVQRRRFVSQIIDHSGGDRGTYKGLAGTANTSSFRPNLPAGSKVFLEFEGMRQAGDIFLNGKPFGLYENGVTAYGVDISGAVHFGDEDNVLAVKVDNRTTTRSVPATDTRTDGTPTTSTPTTAASTGMSGCTSPARSIRPCRSTTAWKAPARICSCRNFNIAGPKLPTSPSNRTVPRPNGASGDRATVELSAVIVDG